jgi:hypothetical protein
MVVGPRSAAYPTPMELLSSKAAARPDRRFCGSAMRLVYSLLKSGRDYDRIIVEQAIQKRPEQAANAGDNRVKEALPGPDRKTRSCHSHHGN